MSEMKKKNNVDVSEGLGKLVKREELPTGPNCLRKGVM